MSDKFPPVPGREPMLDGRTNKISRVWFLFFDNFAKAIDGIILLLQTTEQNIADALATISGKQDNLVSGTNIKTILGQSVLGSGNLEIDIPPVVTSRTASYTEANLKGRIISICDAVSGNIVISLPDCATCSGMFFTAKKIDASANTVTLDPNVAQTIDGSATSVITVQYNSITIFSNGSTWYRI